MIESLIWALFIFFVGIVIGWFLRDAEDEDKNKLLKDKDMLLDMMITATAAQTIKLAETTRRLVELDAETTKLLDLLDRFELLAK